MADSVCITDIHRASTVDGPGLRTTVFLKGCPLHCLWCHNPETQRRGIELGFDQNKCNGCGSCLNVAQKGAIRIENGKARLDRSACGNVSALANACPQNALFTYGKQVSISSVITEILKDRDYYGATGGGVTISGGEPMAQPEATLALLGSCKEEGIHTVLDTCGAFSHKWCQSILEVADLILFDYKATGEEAHQLLTGASLKPILANLRALAQGDVGIILRCPIIPGLNASEDHLKAIAKLASILPNIQAVHLMSWHTMGNSKYHRLGREVSDQLPFNNCDDEQKQSYRAVIEGKLPGIPLEVF